jgi:prolyl-tRNA synthetase
MTHSDDNGLVLPPKLAPIQVVIVPIYKGQEQLDVISLKAKEIKAKLEVKGIRVKYDDRDNQTPGWKFADYEFKGVPLRIAIGPRDMENGTVELARRDALTKSIHNQGDLEDIIPGLLIEIQDSLYAKALERRVTNTFKVDTFEAFKTTLDKGGFILAHWDGTPETEEKIKEETKATIRCIPLDAVEEEGKCVYSGKPSSKRVVFARAY